MWSQGDMEVPVRDPELLPEVILATQVQRGPSPGLLSTAGELERPS